MTAEFSAISEGLAPGSRGVSALEPLPQRHAFSPRAGIWPADGSLPRRSFALCPCTGNCLGLGSRLNAVLRILIHLSGTDEHAALESRHADLRRVLAVLFE